MIVIKKSMADATDERIREFEIMIRLIDIETVYTRTIPYLTVLNTSGSSGRGPNGRGRMIFYA